MTCLPLFGDQDNNDMAIIPAGQVFVGDYYAMEDLVEISGVIRGNAYLAGSQVVINGTIEGNVFILAGDVEIKGTVQGDLWTLAGSATVLGTIARDAIILSANAQSNAEISGNLTVIAGNAEVEGIVGGNATGLAAQLKVAGLIKNNLRCFVGKLRVLSPARIKGDIKYRSNETASIDPGAKIDGTILYHKSVFRDLMDVPLIQGLVIGSKVATFLMNFIYTFVMGIIIIRMFPRKLSKALHALQEDPLKSLYYGAILLVLFPLASLILLATVIGAPFALTLIALNIVTFYTVKIFTILWVANRLFAKWKWKKNGMMTLFSGQVLYSILVAIPFVGIFFAFLTMVFGLGAVAVAQRE
jgi:cytoskeletal protein CcmA (bactofilin family)